MKGFVRLVERVLWGSRLMTMAAVTASVVAAGSMTFVASVDAIHLVALLGDYPSAAGKERSALRGELVGTTVEMIDGYLLASVLIIFALGIYEIFCGRLETTTEEAADSVLIIRSLDDLKDRLAKLILLVLIVTYFQYALRRDYVALLDLLYLAAGIFLIGGALYLTHPKKDDGHHKKE